MADRNTILKYIVIILVIVLIDIVAGFFIGKKILNWAYKSENVTDVTGSEEQKAQESNTLQEPPGTMIPLEAINLNPAQSSGEIFSCDIVIEAKAPEVIATSGSGMPRSWTRSRVICR